MLVELAAAKLLAPYFGTSIHVWAATLAVTLGGLTCGYLLGSQLAKKNLDSNIKMLRNLLLAAALLTAGMVLISNLVLPVFLNMSLGLGATISLLLFLFPILVCLGSTSPLFINIINNATQKPAGNTAGLVYSVSTLGGIFVTFLAGFYLIPELGIKISTLVGGVILGLSTFLLLILSRDKVSLVLATLLVLIVSVNVFSNKTYNPEFKVIEESDGLLGNIKIIEHDAEWYGQKGKMGRGLVVNNTLQTFMDINDPENSSIWAWSTIIPTTISTYPKGSKVLLCGLGGGTIAMQLDRLGFDYDIVEIDKRIDEYAKKYFGLDKNKVITIDDARHYIKTCAKKYDVVIFDTFLSESAPGHLLTSEALDDIRNILNEDGLFLANFYGFTSGERGYAARSVLKTMQRKDWNAGLIATPGKEENRNLLFVATERPLDFSEAKYSEPGFDREVNINRMLLNTSRLNLKDAEILHDDMPKLAKLYAEPAKSWKRAYNSFYTENLYE